MDAQTAGPPARGTKGPCPRSHFQHRLMYTQGTQGTNRRTGPQEAHTPLGWQWQVPEQPCKEPSRTPLGCGPWGCTASFIWGAEVREHEARALAGCSVTVSLFSPVLLTSIPDGDRSRGAIDFINGPTEAQSAEGRPALGSFHFQRHLQTRGPRAPEGWPACHDWASAPPGVSGPGTRCPLGWLGPEHPLRPPALRPHSRRRLRLAAAAEAAELHLMGRAAPAKVAGATGGGTPPHVICTAWGHRDPKVKFRSLPQKKPRDGGAG